jgi:dihydroorotase-like cyclic amidohydrolase
LFRWEKEERLKASAKFWILAAMLPIVLAGGWQVWRGSNFAKTQALARERSRTISWLIHDARLFLGDGTVIERGALLIRKGKIVQIFEGAAPAASSLRAEPVEASGKTVLPGFIDSLTFLGYEAGPGRPASKQAIERALKAYLYCGIVALRDQTALIPLVRDAAAAARRGEIAGPEVFPTPPAGNLAGVPLLNAQDIRLQLQEGQTSFLEGSLVQQVLPAGSVEPLRQAAARWRATQTPLFSLPGDSVAVLAGSGSGASEFEPHGPLLHRELQLWVRQGISPRDALLAATTRGALVIGASQRLGRLAPGFEASLLVVEGNPLTDISTTERIWRVFFKGEMVSRSALFEQRGY